MAEYIERLDTLPAHMREGIKAWIEQGRPTGSFLHALLSNDLMGAIGKADDQNSAAMRQWCNYLYNYAPAGCFGSLAKVAAWAEHRGLKGQVAA